ncbi:hypothetical protein ABPG72_022381 [Tetrahymena utriculariae]
MGFANWSKRCNCLYFSRNFWSLFEYYVCISLPYLSFTFRKGAFKYSFCTMSFVQKCKQFNQFYLLNNQNKKSIIGLGIFNYADNLLMGSKSEGYNNFFLFYVIIFLISLGVSCFIYFQDHKYGSILNSATPQRYFEYLSEKRNKVNSSCFSEEASNFIS